MVQTIETTLTNVKQAEQTLITRVYGFMSLALLVTALVAFVTAATPSLAHAIVSNQILFFGLIIGELGLVMYLSSAVAGMDFPTALRVFLAYSFLNGLTFSVIFLAYTAGSIASTFFITAGAFGAMSAYGYFTKADLTRLGSLCIMAVFGLIIASVVNIFMHSSMLYWLITYAGILIFVGLTAYDTQKIKNMSYAGEGDNTSKLAVIGALTLYLDFINLFLMMLRLFGSRRN
ncbi:MAG: Bax inhibitor-1/YccA family protein [Candidatus Margulisiibacteriota bacterium]|jgi:hypothetical protein